MSFLFGKEALPGILRTTLHAYRAPGGRCGVRYDENVMLPFWNCFVFFVRVYLCDLFLSIYLIYLSVVVFRVFRVRVNFLFWHESLFFIVFVVETDTVCFFRYFLVLISSVLLKELLRQIKKKTYCTRIFCV